MVSATDHAKSVVAVSLAAYRVLPLTSRDTCMTAMLLALSE